MPGGKRKNVLSARERKQKHYEKIRSNPEKYEEQKRKERERWKRRVQEKNVKQIGDVDAREKRLRRRKWRQAQQKCRNQKKLNNNMLSPPASPDHPDLDGNMNDLMPQPGPSTVNSQSGRKRILKKRSKTVRKLKKAEKALDKSQKLVAKYRVQMQRLKKKMKNLEDTPKKQVDALLKEMNERRGVHKVRRRLIFQQAFINQIKLKRKLWKKKNLSNELSMKIIKKYKMATWLNSELGICMRKKKKQEKKPGNQEVSESVKKLIVQFYEREDVSRITAGKKSTITKATQKKQRQYLIDDLGNLHKKYNALYRNSQVSYQTFCRLRPFWVLFPRADARDTCNCQKCENLFYMAKVLNQNGVLESSNVRSLAEQSYCSLNSGSGYVAPDCLAGNCQSHCPKSLPINDEASWQKEVSWFTWTNKTIDPSKDRRDGTGPSMSVKVTVKETKTTSLLQLREEFEELFDSTGRRHIINHIHQASVLTDLKSKLKAGEVVITIDFAENYSCKYGTEVQSIHFGASRDQVTIHDGVIYVDDKVLAFATISNSMRHDPPAIWAYLEPVLKWLSEEYGNTNILHFVSDGPTTQYRNKMNFYMLCTWLRAEFPRFETVTWNFSGAGHGKSAADGVGASIKRSADKLVAEGSDVTDAKNLFERLQKREQSKVKMFYTPANNVEEMADHIPLSMKSISGTMKIHQIVAGKGEMSFRQLSCFCKHPDACDCFGFTRHVFVNQKPNNDEQQLSEVALQLDTNEPQQPDEGIEKLSEDLVGKWVIVVYGFDDTPFPGIVTEYLSDHDEVKVKVMRQKGQNHFNWPLSEDCVAYSSIACLIKEPSKQGRHYHLNKKDWEKYCDLL